MPTFGMWRAGPHNSRKWSFQRSAATFFCHFRAGVFRFLAPRQQRQISRRTILPLVMQTGTIERRTTVKSTGLTASNSKTYVQVTINNSSNASQKNIAVSPILPFSLLALIFCVVAFRSRNRSNADAHSIPGDSAATLLPEPVPNNPFKVTRGR